MTWGALNNHREKAASEPLPGFLTGQGNKVFGDKSDPHFQIADDVIVQKTERPQGARKDSGRGYGVAYPGPINIQMSKKTLFASLVFFAIIVVLTFCIGYLVGNVSAVGSALKTESMPPLKKPIIPPRKKGKQETVKLEKITEAPVAIGVPAAIPENEEGFATSDLEEGTATVALKNKNNKDTDSETSMETRSPETETETDDSGD